jgi:hypothetical protein
MRGTTSTRGIVAREVCRRVHNNLTSADEPEPLAQIVRARTLTKFGDVVIARSSVPNRQGDT